MKVRLISENHKKGTAMVIVVQEDGSRTTRHLKGNGSFWTDNNGNKFAREGNIFTMGQG